MAGPTLLQLVENGTMDSVTAATLGAITAERHSFITVALPRLAGKSTVSEAMLRFVPDGTALHYVTEDEAEMDRLSQHPDGGYLVVGEFSPMAIFPDYLWGSPVRKVFETMRAGFSLATSLHASSLEEAYDAVCRGNGVSDGDASHIKYLVYIERMGSNMSNFWRRVAGVYEVDKVVQSMPQARLLHRWIADGDRFEQVEEPRLLASGSAALAARASQAQAMVDAGRTTEADVAALIAGEFA